MKILMYIEKHVLINSEDMLMMFPFPPLSRSLILFSFPFGVSPSIKAFKHIKLNCVAYVDEILIVSQNSGASKEFVCFDVAFVMLPYLL